MVTTVSPPPKTAEPMEMPFREKTRVGPRNRVLYGCERWQHQANTTDWLLLLYQNTIDLFLIKQETWLPEAVGAIETHTEISSNCRPEVHRYIIDWKVSLMMQKDIRDCTGRYAISPVCFRENSAAAAAFQLAIAGGHCDQEKARVAWPAMDNIHYDVLWLIGG